MHSLPTDSPIPLRPAAILRDTPAAPDRIALGFSGEAEWLGGGLIADGLHETYAAASQDHAAATGFALLLAELKRRQLPSSTPIGPTRAGPTMTSAPPLIWAFEERGGRVPYGPGLVELGLDPAAITLLRLADPSSVLRAGLDALRTGAATVLIELHGSQPLLDLTASRRLAFAAQQSGALALLCRGNAPPGPSAAHSRWQVAAAPSRALLDGSDLNAPGHPAFTLTLLRQRGGRDGLNLLLEWERDTYSFREYRPGFHEYHKADDIPDIGQSACHLQPSLPGVVSALAAGRAGGGRGPGLG